VDAGKLVSVVVPSFGHVSHLEEALRSVAAQSYPSLELIVVDDASPDGSARLAERILGERAFADRFEGRVRLIVHESNEGAHAAINRGLGVAQGDLLTILNSDDAYAPERIATLVPALRECEAGLAFTRVEYVGDADSTFASERFRLRRHQDGIARHASVGFACLCSNVAITTGNLFFTRALWEAAGPFASLRYCHDWDFLVRAVAWTEPIFVARPLYRYRLHRQNSYKNLEGVAEAETQVVLGGYFSSVRTGALRNPIAPSPAQWPGVFDHVMDRHGFWRHW
jgi:glycosyltransferase involved in cell wall biosynthesis